MNFDPISERKTPDGEPVYAIHPLILKLAHELEAELEA
jgi:hypothetical protein